MSADPAEAVLLTPSHPPEDESFWSPVAQQALHWYHHQARAWLTLAGDTDGWTGWDAETAARAASIARWLPWYACRDETLAPVVRWFHGARTNAAFNEIDRH
eukprot:2635164-Prymnesium_polylepis.1